MLLESAEVGDPLKRSPRQTVIRGILQRYFEEEANFPGKKFFPRFFLNDVVRLWRTIAVDYAAKNSERGGEKWALRSAKLRFSRKILYVAGLLLTYETSLFPVSTLTGHKPTRFNAKKPQFSSTEHCFLAAQLTPLELLARACMEPTLDISKKDALIIYSAYDKFLGILNTEKDRDTLAGLSYEDALDKRIFREVRDLSHKFQAALDRIFLNPKTKLGKLTLRYTTF